MMKKRNISRAWALLLTLAMILALTPTSALADDIDGHWAAPYIEQAYERGWMLGDGAGNFRPDASITRAEFAVMLWRALGSPLSPDGDIPPLARGRIRAHPLAMWMRTPTMPTP